MKRNLMLMVLAAMMLVLASTAYADWEVYGDNYYQFPVTCPGATNPANDPQVLSGGNWPAPWVFGAPPLPLAVNPGACILLGKENLNRPWIKNIRVVVTYTGGDLDLQEAVWGNRPATRVTSGIPAPAALTKSDAGGVLTVEFFVAQPDWEYIRLVNNGGTAATITNIQFMTQCNAIPSLTEWGMISLGVLILAAGAMVIVRRRRAVASA